MERFKIIKKLGSGSFGDVLQALNKENGEIVAIKRLKSEYSSWEECLNLNEVKVLRKMNHPNIVKLKEITQSDNVLYFIFEYMDSSLHQFMKARSKPFKEVEVRGLCYQLFQALSYLHQHGYFHRDLKPENLLVSKGLIKIADFGSARESCSQTPGSEYVTTRWYRAPEVLLHSTTYNSAVDMWAMGAIMAELFMFSPLFPGKSEADEIYKICEVIGSPNNISWDEGLQLASEINYQFPQFNGVNFYELIPSASEDAINLIKSLCSWDPSKRPTSMDVLCHPFFQSYHYNPSSFLHHAPLVEETRVLEQKMEALSLHASVQRKVEIDYQQEGLNQNETSCKCCCCFPIQSRYQLYTGNNLTSICIGKTEREVYVIIQMLAQMMIFRKSLVAAHEVFDIIRVLAQLRPPLVTAKEISDILWILALVRISWQPLGQQLTPPPPVQQLTPPPPMMTRGWHGHTSSSSLGVSFIGHPSSSILPKLGSRYFYQS